MIVAWVVVGVAAILGFYTYLGYPLALRLLAGRRETTPIPPSGEEWPAISFSVPAYNEEAQIEDLLESLLAIDYPADRRQIVVVSDASSDGTDEIVAGYADRGIELVRLPQRSGKTAAEAEAARHLTGDIVINTDASIRIAPDAVKKLVARFRDPSIGVASGRDVSVAPGSEDTGEGGYVGYEMEIRRMETRLHGIIGASGCFYAIRRPLHTLPLPDDLSRDFAAALHAEENGYRAVSVDEAVSYVPATSSIQREYRRKVRTIERGMHTLWHKRHLLDPVRHPVFAWMLFSHKILRWLLPWIALAGLLALAALATTHAWALAALGLAALAVVVAGAAWWAAARGFAVPGPTRGLAFAFMGNVAAAAALVGLLFGQRQAIWEPTRRNTQGIAAGDDERSDRAGHTGA